MPITPPLPPLHPEMIALAIGLALSLLGLRRVFRHGGRHDDGE